MPLTSWFSRRWDSSDPDRAPPPLPLNPGATSPITKPNTSATVAAAAEAIANRVRESQYITNLPYSKSPEKSPEKSLMKGQYHKRMQSMGNGTVRDLSSYLENTRSPERSPERSRTPLDFEKLSDRTPTRSGTPTPISKEMNKEIPPLRPMSRPPLKAILDETPPQSAAMRALQGTPSEDRETSSAHLSNSSTSLVRTPQSIDGISSQILSLTTIATNLQREMAQLSRRSKDNASDLISLKEATNSRDEDIRKSLRDLVSNLTIKAEDLDVDRTSRRPYNRSANSYFLDEKPHTSPSMAKSISLPRIPSPASFSANLNREIAAMTPNPYSMDGAAAIALLEKILREMGTKEGQEKLALSLSEMVKKSPSDASTGSEVPKRLEEILKLLKESPDSKALVRASNSGSGVEKPPQVPYNYASHPGVALARANRNITPRRNSNGVGEVDAAVGRPADFVGEEMMKLLKRIKDSITESGGLTGEVKALVRELRGEVLGMGREIGRKLEQAESSSNSNSREDAQGPGREEIAQIVEEGLIQLKEHMDNVMREHRRQSAASIASRSTVDAREIHAAIQSAIREIPPPQPQVQGSGIEREEILEAVREAWETYKPEIELQNFGLERDEILECLEKGLQDYKSQQASNPQAITYDEVLDAVRMGLRDFKPPGPPDTESSITRDEIIMTVRECLESFEFPSQVPSTLRESEVTREDVLSAVKEGLLSHVPLSKELEFNREDLFDAVRAGLEAAPPNAVGEEILDKMQDLIEGMRSEFQQYSAANGRDTEQVLDAMKDGMEVLRANIETYVDRASDVTGKDEIIDTVKVSLENLRIDLEGSIANGGQPSAPTSSGELLDVMEKEFEHLRSTISSSMARGEVSDAGREEVLDAIREGFADIKGTSTRSLDSDPESMQSVQEELRHLRETLATTITRSGGAVDREDILETVREGIDRMQLETRNRNGRPESILSNTGELLEAFHEGLDNLKADIERVVSKEGIESIKVDIERVVNHVSKPVDMTVNYEILDMLKDGLAAVRADLDKLVSRQTTSEVISSQGREVVIAEDNPPTVLSRPDIENLEVMITQLKMKVEALDNQPPPPPPTQAFEDAAIRPDIERLEGMIKDLQTNIEAVAARDPAAPENAASKEDVMAIETLLMNAKARLDEIVIPDPETTVKIEQIEALEILLKRTKDAVDDLTIRQEDSLPTKEDLGLVEVVVRELQAGFEEMREKASEDNLKRPDIEALEALCVDTQTQVRELVPEGDALASKSNLSELQFLVKEFHKRTEAFQEKVTVDAEMTAQAFEARKIEHGGLADKIEDVKAFLDDVRSDLKSKIESSGSGIEGLAVTLTALGEAVTAANSAEGIKEMRETLDAKFEELHGSHKSAKTEAESSRDAVLGRHDEHKAAIIEEITAKIDSRFDEIMTKYDDAQLAASTKATILEEKNAEATEAMSSTKAIAEDLKLLIDALGPTVTESCNNMSEDSKTVFNKVEEITVKLDSAFTSLAADGKEDHLLTRNELSKASITLENLQTTIADHNPKVMEAINDVLNVMSQHFEMSQRSSEEIRTSVRDIPNTIALPALPAPVPSPTEEKSISAVEQYNDAEIHAKLDKLVEYASEAGKTTAQFEMLEQIKTQVTTTAADFDAFIKSQLSLTAETQESKSREVEEMSIALEKRIAQKENVEADIVRLMDEKTTLSSSVSEFKESIDMLKQEEKEMLSIKAKLQAELSSLETALQIRKEEMHIMEARAERLERRIIEGVLDQSRSVLLNSRPQASLNAMNLKRVASAASSNATTTAKSVKPASSKLSSSSRAVPPAAASTVSNAVGMALKKRQPPSTTGSPASNSRASRRILSLSTISGNKGAVKEGMGLADPSITTKSNLSSGLGALKRSHSVKTNFPSRKSSWGGTKQIGLYADNNASELDKENSVLEEEEEDEYRSRSGSESSMERRSSYAGTFVSTTDGGGGGRESYASQSVTDSAVDDRRTSLAPSTTLGTIDLGDEFEDASQGEGDDQDLREDGSVVDGDDDDEDEEEEEHERGDQLQLYTGNNMIREQQVEAFHSGSKDIVPYGITDSGLGTEPPTAALEDGGRFFERD